MKAAIITTTIVGLIALAGVSTYFFRLRWIAERKEAEVRAQLPFVSLVDRIPAGRGIPPAQPLDTATQKRWDEIDTSIMKDQQYRAGLLKHLHERTKRFFISSPGEGPSRVSSEGWEEYFLLLPGSRIPNLQPGEAATFSQSPSETVPRGEADDLMDRHRLLLGFFVSGLSYGYVKDGSQVAGFQPHRLHPLGNDEIAWKIDNILLVGILTQPEPVVYLSDRLPSMELVRQGKTRSLDLFEVGALREMEQGRDLVIVKKDDTLRMFGALRATKVCQQCHDTDVGNLLGAFSYTLRPTPLPPPAAEPDAPGEGDAFPLPR